MSPFTVICDWEHNDVFDSDEYQVFAENADHAVSAAARMSTEWMSSRWPGCRLVFAWVCPPEWAERGHSPQSLGGDDLIEAVERWGRVLAMSKVCGTIP